MIPIFHERHFTFRFAEPRIVARFHLDGVGSCTNIRIYRWLTPAETLGDFVAIGQVGTDGWVDLLIPLTVDASLGFRVELV